MNAALPAIPRFVGREGRACWRVIAAKLARLGRLNDETAGYLGITVQAYTTYRQVHREWRLGIAAADASAPTSTRELEEWRGLLRGFASDSSEIAHAALSIGLRKRA
jgi:phage terminase small subunit